MIKKIVLCVGIFASTLSYSAITASCPHAQPSDSPGFCSSFKSVAQCHCTSSGLPVGMCNDMKLLYARMISIFGSVQRACEFQHDTLTQDCIDSWHCYLVGGRNSNQGLCSSTGTACS